METPGRPPWLIRIDYHLAHRIMALALRPQGVTASCAEQLIRAGRDQPGAQQRSISTGTAMRVLEDAVDRGELERAVGVPRSGSTTFRPAGIATGAGAISPVGVLAPVRAVEPPRLPAAPGDLAEVLEKLDALRALMGSVLEGQRNLVERQRAVEATVAALAEAWGVEIGEVGGNGEAA